MMTREELVEHYYWTYGDREKAERKADEILATQAKCEAHIAAMGKTATPLQPKPSTPVASRLSSETRTQAETRTKHGKQVREILKRLLNGEHVRRENSGKLYGVRNAGECVRQLRKLGYTVINHEPDGVFAYYYMRASDIDA